MKSPMLAFALSLLAAVGSLATLPPPALGAATFVVNRIGDAADLNPGDGTCDTSTASGRQCTLRAAIQEANALAGTDTINFKITSTSKTITPASPLPPITEQVTINGYSQKNAKANTKATGNNAVLKIVLDGVNAGADADGLVMAGYRVTVKGLVIQRFGGTGIVVSGTKSTVQGNRIGTNAAGTLARGNQMGVLVTGDQNSVGGSAPAARNLVSGNAEEGIRIDEDAAKANVVAGNYVGTTAAGGAALGNGGSGVMIARGANLNRIGGTAAGAGNLISANGDYGVVILGSYDNAIEGNRIGTKADGSGDLGNAETGVSVQASSDNVIGGTTAGAGNLISGNGASGINLHGTASFDNVAQGNVVRLNDEHGFHVSSRRGIIAGNVVFGNALDGIEIFEFPQATANRNRITANQIFGNGGLGIDLVGGSENSLGVTANDTGDGDLGPNDLQNFPVLISARRSNASGVTTVTGTLNGIASTDFRIELFIAAADPSGHGEGQILVGARTITTNSSGNRGFSFASGQLPAGAVLTATAIHANLGSTSEFSASITVIPGP